MTSEQLMPRCVLIEVASLYDWLHKLTITRLRQSGPVRLVLVTESDELARQRYADILQKDDAIILRPSVSSIKGTLIHREPSAIYAEARGFERKYGFLYVRDIIGQDRRYADLFQAEEHPLPRNPQDEGLTQIDLTEYINLCYRLYEGLFVQEGIDLVLSRPDGLALAPCIQVAEHFGVPHTFCQVASHKTRVWWTYGAYRGETMLREALEARLSEPQEIKTLDYDIRHIYKAFQNFSELAEYKTLAKQLVRFLLIRAVMFTEDLRAGKFSRRTSFWKSLRHFSLIRRAGHWLQTHGIRNDTLENTQYLVVLLPVEPEFNTHSQTREFWHTEAVIRQLAICLPAGYRLVVKEHSANLGNRQVSFYRRINRISNVSWADHRILGSSLLPNAAAVATCAGTVSLESALLGKPCIIFGQRVVFSFLPHILVPESMKLLNRTVAEAVRPRTDEEIQRFKEYGSRAYRAIEDISFDAADTPIYGGTKTELPAQELERCSNLLLQCFRRQLRDFRTCGAKDSVRRAAS